MASRAMVPPSRGAFRAVHQHPRPPLRPSGNDAKRPAMTAFMPRFCP
ncbi:MAG: hypothetical protein RIR65_1888, partial [Planctomycetota bacterium]